MEGSDSRDMSPAFESDIGISNEVSDLSSIPTHVIVQRQLNDLILSQHAAVERLKFDATMCLKEKYVSREVYEEALRDSELEKREKFVPREKYEEVCQNLEAERQAGMESRAELTELAEKLEFALGQIELLTKQLEREKAAYQKSFSLLKVKTIKESTKNVALETKNSEMEKEKVVQEDVLESKDREIESLEQRLRAQDEVYKKQLGEMSVKLQQERYIAQTLSGDGGRVRAEKAAGSSDKISDKGRVTANKGRVNIDKSWKTLGDKGRVKPDMSSKTSNSKALS